MRQKIVYTVSVIASFFIGIVGTLLVVHFVPVKVNEIEKTVSEVSITETNTIKSAINKIYDAVVYVETYKGTRASSSGTGFFYKKDDKYGYLITNHHVIEGGTTIKVTNIQGKTAEAKVLGSDAYADIAVLSVDVSEVIKVAEIGDSSKSELGDTLFTVGSPVGKEYMGTVTRGILSGKDRTVSVDVKNTSFMMEVLQTDAAINPGNSGGPLVNINGEVIGVNSLKLVEDEIEGMGFAIPIEMVMNSIERLEKGEEIKRPLIGIEMLDVNNTYSLYLNNIYLKEDFENGVVVINVEKDMPAAKAGLQKGDVILEVDGTKIQDGGHFKYTLYKYDIGSKVKIKYYRDGKINETEMTLDKSVEDK